MTALAFALLALVPAIPVAAGALGLGTLRWKVTA